MSSSPVARYHDQSVTVAVNTGNTTYTRPVFGSQKDENPIRVRVIADVGFHVAWNRPATTSDARVPAECIEYYSVGVGDTLNFTRASIDGNIWVTVVGLS